MRRSQVLVVALALAVSAAAAVVVTSIVEPAASRFAGTTANRGSLLGAGAVDLSLVASDDVDGPASTTTELIIDASNLVPGQLLERCLVIAYRGSIEDVDVRLYGRTDANSGGLEDFMNASVDVGSGADSECSDFEVPDVAPTTWSGTLSEFSDAHGSFSTGIPVLSEASSEATATVRARFDVDGDNRAQGLTAAFWLVVEVRP